MKNRVLNLYAGIGGNRKLWEDCEVTAIEYKEDIAEVYRSLHPNDTVIVADALDYLLKHFREFDFIWSSPPCPSHSVTNHFLKGQEIFRMPDMTLYQQIIFLSTFFKGKYCVENVTPYYEPLIKPTTILGRHYFWANFYISPLEIDYVDIGTMNRNASKEAQRKAIIREAQIPKLIDLHGMKDFRVKNKRQVLRNCVLPEIGAHIFNCAKGIINQPKTNQTSLF